MEKIINEYEKQAQDFLDKTNSKIEIEFLKRDYHFTGDTEKRNIYKITLSKGIRKYTFNFGDSIHNTYGDNKYLSNFIKEYNILIEKDILKNLIMNSKYIFTSTEKTKIKEIINRKPSNYDILACLNADYIDSFEDFCGIYGYDIDSRTAEKTYKAVKKEQDELIKLYSDEEIILLNEIN